MDDLICEHCLSRVKAQEAVIAELDGEEKAFCCTGCHGIYLLLHERGLDEFYARRRDWKAGRPEPAEVDPDLFREHVRSTGGKSQIDLNISGIRCASCIWLIERYLSGIDGILSVRVNYATHRARIEWSPERTDLGHILRSISSIGYTPLPFSPSAGEEAVARERKDLLVRFGTASFFSMQLMLYTATLYAGYFHGIEEGYRRIFQFIAWGLATPVMFYSGYPFIRSALRGIRNRTVNMDTLVAMGSFSAYAYSVFSIFAGGEVYFDTSAMIITLILLGRLIEAGAKGKATEVISRLLGLQPAQARLVRKAGGEHVGRIVPLSVVSPGDEVEVIPGDRVPVDADVVEGASEVDESMLTGEPMPVPKQEGSKVYGGTINLDGRLLLRVSKTGNKTVLARIIKSIEEAQARKAPIQSVADRVVGWFVPAILMISLLTLAARLFNTGDTASSLMTAVSVLVVACPCALGLATPLAILTGTTAASSRGILIRGGDIIETAARTGTVCLDKTGTLTEGRPVLEEIVPYGIDRDELHRLAASAERSSEHTIARAIREGMPEGTLSMPAGYRTFAGRGLKCTIDGRNVTVGSPAFLATEGVMITDEQRDDLRSLSRGGKTVIGLAAGQQLMGWFSISDRIRPEAARAISELLDTGLDVYILTGDQVDAAAAIAGQAGIRDREKIMAPLSPVEKADRVRELTREGRRVMMVGDGINDAPALAEADVGTAMGRGTDIAIESADAVLMKNDLTLVPELIRISGDTLRVIRQNLFWAFSYNLITVPLAVAGRIHPIVSAALMAMSSLIVVGNSLRLKKRRQDYNPDYS